MFNEEQFTNFANQQLETALTESDEHRIQTSLSFLKKLLKDQPIDLKSLSHEEKGCLNVAREWRKRFLPQRERTTPSYSYEEATGFIQELADKVTTRANQAETGEIKPRFIKSNKKKTPPHQDGSREK